MKAMVLAARPLGSPHNGPDAPDNILCLCPNHHALFDHGGAGISGDLALIGAEGRLTVDPRHTLNESHLSYRREHYQIKGWSTQLLGAAHDRLGAC